MNTSQLAENKKNKVLEEQLSFRLPADERNAFAGKVKGAGLDFKIVLRQLVLDYLSGGEVRAAAPVAPLAETTPQFAAANAYWHELLEIILASETKHAIDAIQRNLEMFAFAVEVAGPKSPDEIRGILQTLREGKDIDKRKNTKKPKKSTANLA